MNVKFALLIIIIIVLLISICLLIVKYKLIVKNNDIKQRNIDDLTRNTQNQFDNIKYAFENIASSILDNKSDKIVNINKNCLDNILTPLKLKIDEFKSDLNKYKIYEIEKISELHNEIDNLQRLNKQLSDDANNLASALKGDNKIQGLWGELTIKRIFENTGMVENIDYVAQKQFKDEVNCKKIPDYIVNLPNKKHIIIDAKTSLSAYSKYCNSTNEKDKKIYLKEHFTSIKKHIDELISKDYVNILELHQAEYILMFIPIDKAVSIIFENKIDIITYAYSKNIMIVTPSTLLITLKTVEYLRRQELQTKNVTEIVRQSGMLYDKFVTFTEILLEVDNKIVDVQNKMKDAIKRLSYAEQSGDSIINRAKKIKDLGAYTKKEISEKLF
jgi:DNA recombination protein RmuC